MLSSTVSSRFRTLGSILRALTLAACASGTRTDDPGDRQGDALSSIQQFPSTDACAGGRWHCFAKVSTRTGEHSHAGAAGLRPVGSRGRVHARHEQGGRDDRDRRRVQLPERRERPRDLPQQYGLPPCTTANGCLKIVNQDGADVAAAGQRAGERRLDGRGRARPRHGERRVPELQADPRPGERRPGRRPVHRAERRGEPAARPSSATAGAVPRPTRRRRATRPTSTTPASASSSRPATTATTTAARARTIRARRRT